MLSPQAAKAGKSSRDLLPTRNEQFIDLVVKLHNVARTMDGSLVRRDQFARTVQEILDLSSDERELATLAQTTRSLHADNFSLQRFYDEAFAAILPPVPYSGPNTTNTRMLLSRLEPLQTDADIIGPEITLGFDSKIPAGRPFAPNLANVLQVLFDKGTTLEDITYQFNPTDEARYLTLGYTLLTIPDRNCQILVCDRTDRPVYMLEGIRNRKFWADATPRTLGQDAAITKLDMTNAESLYRSLNPKLPARKEIIVPSYKWVDDKKVLEGKSEVPMEQYWDRRRRYEISERFAFPVLKRRFHDPAPAAYELRETPRAPSPTQRPFPSSFAASTKVNGSGTNGHGTLPEKLATSIAVPAVKKETPQAAAPTQLRKGSIGRRGRTIDIKGRNSDIQENVERYILAYNEFPNSSPPKKEGGEAKRRSFVVDHMWLTRTQEITLTEFIERWIDRVAKAYREANNGQNPTAKSGTIGGSALTWELIDLALRNRKRGEAISLDLFLRRKEDGHEARWEAFRSKPETAKADKPRAIRSEVVTKERGSRAYNPDTHLRVIWANVEDYITAYNEFPNSSAPKADEHGHKRRSFVVEHMWLTKRKDTTLTGLIDAWIDQKAEAYRAAHDGKNPDVNSRAIEGSKLDWAVLDKALKNRKRGEAMSLDLFLRRHEDGHETRLEQAKAPRRNASVGQPKAAKPLNDPDLDPVDQCLEHLKTHGKFPYKLADGRLGSEVWKPWVIERIRQYRQMNATGNPLKTSGPVHGFETIDWAMLDTAILANGRISKINLEGFIEKNWADIARGEYKEQSRVRRSQSGADDDAKSIVPKWRKATRISLLVPDFSKAVNGRIPGKMVRVPYNQTIDTPQSLDDVKRRILEFAAKGRGFPGSNAEYKNQRERDFWKEQANWLLAMTNMPMSKYIMSWTRVLADDFRLAHDGQTPNENSGLIQGLDPHTWEHLVSAYKRDSTKPPFESVIALAETGNKPALK